MRWDRYILTRLLIAIPELQASRSFLAQLVEKGIVTENQASIIAFVTGEEKIKPLHDRALLERIAMLVPEILSVRAVDILRNVGLISERNASLLRIGMRTAGRLVPQLGLKDATVYQRMGMVFDDIFSPELVSFIRKLDDEHIAALAQILRKFPEGYGNREAIFGHARGTLTSGDGALIREMLERSIARAQALRSVISLGRMGRDTVAGVRAADGAWDMLGLVFDDLLSDKLLRNLVRAGVISSERYAVFSSVAQLGAGIWRKVAAGATYESWAARGLLLSEGILSPEAIKMLVALGRLTPKQAAVLYPVAEIIREVTRGVGANWRKAQRYRVIPGEPPIRTFARYTRTTDSEILKLLAEAANDASKAAERLAKTASFAKQTRAAQQRLVANQIHGAMHDLWDQVGHLIIFGEKEAGLAAVDAMSNLENAYGTSGGDLQRSLRFTAKAGVDSYVSREESLRDLSRRVYRNIPLANGQVDREIAKALLRGESASELAATVARFIRPDVPGGVAYAAKRLARTEINNAFHQTAIRYTREMPWVEAYRWNLSGSHGRPDICNTYANDNHGHGRGLFNKGDVPGKPHPQCLCYITAETVDSKVFYRRLRSGAYGPYIDGITGNGVFDEDTYTPTQAQGIVAQAAKDVLVRAFSAAAVAYLQP